MNNVLQEEERAFALHLQRLISWEENFLRQKARCNWLNLGDLNTSYFFKLVKQRRTRSAISQLMLPNGELCYDQAAIFSKILAHFKNYLSSTKERKASIDSSVFQERVISIDEYEGFCREVTVQEITNAL